MRRRTLTAGLLAAALPLPALAEGRRGGEATVALAAAPASLDAQANADHASRVLAFHISETLYSLDESGNPQPALTEGVETSADRLTWRFGLRRGVAFHNGKPLTSADARASLERGQRVGPRAAALNPAVAWEAPDPATLVARLSRPFPGLLGWLAQARSPLAIMPEEECAKPPGRAGAIGTGPFALAAFEPGRAARLVRFDRYAANPASAGPVGFGGRRTAWLDAVTFRFRPGPAALLAGEVQVAESVDAATARRLAESGIAGHELMPWASLALAMNIGIGLTARVDFRRAVATALDAGPILQAAAGGLYRENAAWDAAAEPGPPSDEAEARRLLRAARYLGEEMVIALDDHCPPRRAAALAVAAQLRRVGINVKFDPVPAGSGAWNLRPLLLGIEPFEGRAAVAGRFGAPRPVEGAAAPEIERSLAALAAGDGEAAWRAFTGRLGGQAMAVKLGEVGIVQAVRRELAGFTPFRIPRLWDCWRA